MQIHCKLLVILPWMILSSSSLLSQKELYSEDFELSGEFYKITGFDNGNTLYYVISNSESPKKDTFYVTNSNSINRDLFKNKLLTSIKNVSIDRLNSQDTTFINNLNTSFSSASITTLNPYQKAYLVAIKDKFVNSCKLDENNFINFTGNLPQHLTDSDGLFLLTLFDTIKIQKEALNLSNADILRNISTSVIYNSAISTFNPSSLALPIGTLEIKDKVAFYKDVENSYSPHPAYFNYNNPKNPSDSTGKIDSLIIHFSEGTIKDMELHVTVGTEHIVFHNDIPFSFSSKKDIVNYPNRADRVRRLYLYKFHYSTGAFEYPYLPYVFVNEFIDYNRILQLYTEDYSPGDQIITIKPFNNIRLHKENIYQLLDARIFSDLVGTDNSEPNGLIQIQVEKKIILNPRNFYFFPSSYQRMNLIKQKRNSIHIDADTLKVYGNKIELSENDKNRLNIKYIYIKDKFKNYLGLNKSITDTTLTLSGPKIQLINKQNKYISPINLKGTSIVIAADKVKTVNDTIVITGDKITIKNSNLLIGGKRSEFIDKRHFSHFTLFNHVTPRITLSKIEEQSKFLPNTKIVNLNQFINMSVDSFGTSPIDLIKYNSFLGGGELGLFSISFPSIKLKYSFDLHAYITKTSAILYPGKERNLNSLLLKPAFSLKINPEARYEAILVYGLNYITDLSDEVVTFSSLNDFISNNGKSSFFNKTFHSFSFVGTFRTNVEDYNKGRLFFASTFNVSNRKLGDNFLQLQLGYAFNILKIDNRS